MKATIIVAAFVAVFSFSPAISAQNLVTNGGFETGDFSGWEQFGDTNFTTVYTQGEDLGGGDTFPVADGTFSAAFGPGGGLGGITQTIDTVPGGDYSVSFKLANADVTANNQFLFSFDDGFQIETDTLPSFGFKIISLPVKASGLTADVSFFFQNPSSYFLLDDVVVTPVPESATWIMLLAGFITVGSIMRRRRLVTA
jgi:hypothetical protein